MKIFRAFGLGILILTLKFLVPTIFYEIEETLLLFLNTTQNGLEIVNEQMANTSMSQ